MIALPQDRGNRTERRRHARRRTDGGRSSFEGRDALFQYRDGRVRDARIRVPTTFQVEDRRCGVRIREHVGRRLIDGRRTRAEYRIHDLSGMQGDGVEVEESRHRSSDPVAFRLSPAPGPVRRSDHQRPPGRPRDGRVRR